MWSKYIAITAFCLSFMPLAQAQTLPPSDVENLEAEAGDREITLTWDAAEDDGFVTGYRIYYGTSAVIEEDDSYEDDLYTNSSEATYTMNNLLNGVAYYFSVTAIDDDDMESINYSNEASATPAAEVTGDTEGPKVISAEHTAETEITVTMSESITPTEPTSFLLSHQASFEEIEVLDILFNSESLVFTIDLGALVPGDTYELTATSAVEDLAGNPVSSGITDTVVFEAQADFAAPVVEELSPEVEAEPEPVVETEPIVVDEPLPVEDIIDDNFEAFDDLFAEVEDVIEAEPDKASAPDTTAPLEAQNLSANTAQMESGQMVVAWDRAIDIDNDITDQRLYTRVGIGAWDEGYSLGPDTAETMIEVEPNQNYQVRLVTIDSSGNRSEGAVFSFSTHLARSGPGTVIALSAALLLGIMMLMSRRRTA